MKTSILALALALPACLSAQMKPGDNMESMHHAPAVPSTSLTITGIDGKTESYSPEDIRNMTHLTVKVHNMHTNADETYSGVPVSELVKRSEPALATGEKPKVRPLMTILIFGATDKYRIALTLCDADPSCRNGMALVADQQDSKPLATDGAFKLIVTEDKKPQRWVRNLTSIEIKAAE
jgi:hypothetical protein